MKYKTLCALFTQACVIFTLIILSIYFCIGLSGLSTSLGIRSDSAFGVFGLSMAVSAANVIWKNKRIGILARYLLHAVITVGASTFLLYIINGLSGKTVLVAEAAIFVLHAIVFSILSVIEKKTERENTDYISMYDKLKPSNRSAQK